MRADLKSSFDRFRVFVIPVEPRLVVVLVESSLVVLPVDSRFVVVLVEFHVRLEGRRV